MKLLIPVLALTAVFGVPMVTAGVPASSTCTGPVCDVCPLIAGAVRGVAIGPIQCVA